jgi:hypothetical protein
MRFYLKSDFGEFAYGRPAGSFPDKSSAIREAKRRIQEGERAWVVDRDMKVVWGTAIKVTKNRVAMGEFWRMKEFNTRPHWVAAEERRRKK